MYHISKFASKKPHTERLDTFNFSPRPVLFLLQALEGYLKARPANKKNAFNFASLAGKQEMGRCVGTAARCRSTITRRCWGNLWPPMVFRRFSTHWVLASRRPILPSARSSPRCVSLDHVSSRRHARTQRVLTTGRVLDNACTYEHSTLRVSTTQPSLAACSFASKHRYGLCDG